MGQTCNNIAANFNATMSMDQQEPKEIKRGRSVLINNEYQEGFIKVKILFLNNFIFF